MPSVKNRNSPSGRVASQKFPGVLFSGGTISTVTVAILTVSVPGVKAATDVLVGVNSVQKTGLVATPSRIAADDVVEICITNPTAASITTGTVTYTFSIQHFDL